MSGSRVVSAEMIQVDFGTVFEADHVSRLIECKRFLDPGLVNTVPPEKLSHLSARFAG